MDDPEQLRNLEHARRLEFEWGEVCRDFYDITDEMVRLRTDKALEVLEEVNIDTSSLLDPSREKDEQAREAEATLEIVRGNLILEESNVAVMFFRQENEDGAFYISSVGSFFVSYPAFVKAMKVQQYSQYLVMGNRIKMMSFTTPRTPEEDSQPGILDMLSYGKQTGAISFEDIALHEARSTLYILRLFRRYVGLALYKRTPLETDPL